jgi:serine protease Do
LTDEEKALTPEKRGVIVSRVEPGSFAADVLGMQDRDIITSVNRTQVNSIDDVKKVQGTLKPGDPVAFRVVRSTGAARRGVASAPATATIILSGTLPE